VARSLREQFILATLTLLVPVVAVMTWALGSTYSAQLAQLRSEAAAIASAIAAHLDSAGPDQDRDLETFLKQVLPAQTGGFIIVSDEAGAAIADYVTPGFRQDSSEVTSATVVVTRRPWRVEVGLPTAVARQRADPIYRRTIAISAVATLVMLAIEALFLRQWRRSLVLLGQRADRVGRGDLRPPPAAPMASRELEQLRDAMTDMVDRLREAREALARQMDEERRMRQEVESLQRQVIRQERLAAIGVLLSGIAHELNNPLQAISGFAQLLQRDPDIKPDMRTDLALIHKESSRASRIIRNLSRFTRQQDAPPALVYLHDIVASVVELRQRRLDEQNIALHVQDGASQPVQAVMAELQQVLLNFVINAEQAVTAAPPRDRRIVIRTADVSSAVSLVVEDSGPGVPPEDESKLFQPFFTTKPVGEGTGLGLSVSYGIIQSLGGTISYRRSELGGAAFSFEIPAAHLVSSDA
jgi:C4-dicarboxylate-specific signal transduction histidine kinase